MAGTNSSKSRKRKATKVVFDVTFASTITSPALKNASDQDVLRPCEEELHQEKLILESLSSTIATLPSSEREETSTVFDVEEAEVVPTEEKEKKHNATAVPEQSPTRSSNWWDMLERLRSFHAQHNHFCVPADTDAQLKNWVQAQSSNSYLSTRQISALAHIGLNMGHGEAMNEKLSSFAGMHRHVKVTSKHDSAIEEQRNPIHPLNHEQQALLQGGGDTVNRKGNSNAWKKDQVWDAQYVKLKSLYEQNGNSNVPREVNDPSLKTWVNAQRTNHRQKKMTQSRIDKLESIKFVWSLERSWNDQYERLKKYKEDKGHCHVPHAWSKEDPHLVQWVSRQRNLFKTGSLSQERIELLTEIGFVWDATGFRGNRARAVTKGAGLTTTDKKRTQRERLISNNQKLQTQQTKIDANQEELDRQQKQLEENGEILEFLLLRLSKQPRNSSAGGRRRTSS